MTLINNWLCGNYTITVSFLLLAHILRQLLYRTFRFLVQKIQLPIHKSQGDR